VSNAMGTRVLEGRRTEALVCRPFRAGRVLAPISRWFLPKASTHLLTHVEFKGLTTFKDEKSLLQPKGLLTCVDTLGFLHRLISISACGAEEHVHGCNRIAAKVIEDGHQPGRTLRATIGAAPIGGSVEADCMDWARRSGKVLKRRITSTACAQAPDQTGKPKAARITRRTFLQSLTAALASALVAVSPG
jgi:hypothetical protein